MYCTNCRWYESQKIETDGFDSTTEAWRFTMTGLCRRHPPRRFVFPDTGEERSGWPKTSCENWCGEWEKMLNKSGSGPGRRQDDWMNDLARIEAATKKAKEQSRRAKPASS